ncbi:MAG: radical SAM family heme chaperone HemW [Nitrososphaerales archaeon]
MTSPLALYLHIPFCAVRCHYCDFNTYAHLDALFEPYASALGEEVRRAGERQAFRVPTVFLGGGTPTVLPPRLLEQILRATKDAFRLDPDAEITSEANPGTTDAELFAAMRSMGVNRLSMGVQSFDDAELSWLGRMHSAAEAETAYDAARRAGFDNINLDFMFGLPGQSLETWSRTLDRALALAPDHISLYSLTVEHGTPLHDAVRRGVQAPPDEDKAADFYLLASDRLAAAGYEQYEISNWSRPGLACRHNLVYWHHEPYLGFGPGAHSFDGRRRWWNVRPVPQYIQRMNAGSSPERDGESIDERLAMGEFMMLGLRLVAEGVADARFLSRFGVSLYTAFDEEIEGLVRRGLLERLPDRVRLTPTGQLLGNQVFAEFLPASE